ncbi:unnamed protein product [Onchocerca ochengi]|uniref:Uncharacterized protein n=1 Tax=Onchocerca ochengi TaxID=42157 RepID=A0A182ERT8_ONCOC|nr:unnamed protein product [Onchocerca ochengi]
MNNSMRAERQAAKHEDVRLREHQSCSAALDLLRPQQNQSRRSCSAASDLLRSEENKREMLRVNGRRQRETGDQSQTRLHVSSYVIKSPCIPAQPSLHYQTKWRRSAKKSSCRVYAKFQGEKPNCHQAVSLLPLPDSEHKCLKMYFIGDSNDKLNARCGIHTDIERSVFTQLQQLLQKEKKQFRELPLLPSSYAGNPRHMHEYVQDDCICSPIWAFRPIHYVDMQSDLGCAKSLTSRAIADGQA